MIFAKIHNRKTESKSYYKRMGIWIQKKKKHCIFRAIGCSWYCGSLEHSIHNLVAMAFRCTSTKYMCICAATVEIFHLIAFNSNQKRSSSENKFQFCACARRKQNCTPWNECMCIGKKNRKTCILCFDVACIFFCNANWIWCIDSAFNIGFISFATNALNPTGHSWKEKREQQQQQQQHILYTKTSCTEANWTKSVTSRALPWPNYHFWISLQLRACMRYTNRRYCQFMWHTSMLLK